MAYTWKYLGAGLAVILCAGGAADAQEMTVYDDALGSGWSDWSWGSERDFSNTDPVYSGTYSLGVTLHSPTSGVSLHHSAIPSDAYDALEFYIHGGTNDAVDIVAYIEDDTNGTYFTFIPLNNSEYIAGGKVSSGIWKRVRIPMEDFDITAPTFTRINFKETNSLHPAFFLDHIRFITEFRIDAPASATTNLQVSFTSKTSLYFQAWLSPSLAPASWSVTGVVLGVAGTQVWTNDLSTNLLFLRMARCSRSTPDDVDADGLDDVYELLHGPLNPVSTHSDADSLPDGWEVQYGLNPTNASGADGDSGDPDGDGRDNLTELNVGTNPGFHERTEAPLYLDYPTGPWGPWQYGGWVETTNTSYVYANHCAARVGIANPDDIAGFQMITEGFSTIGYTNLEFYINGGGNSGQDCYLAARIGTNTWPAGVTLSAYTSVQAGTWSRVRIPLTHLGISATTNLTGIFFKNTNTSAVAQFWIDNMQLVRLWPQMAPSVAVNVTNAVSPVVHKRHFGINTATWDGLLSNSVSVARMAEAGFGILRFPGGSQADYYDWQNNDNKTNASVQYAADTEDFLDVADAIGAEKNITVNYGSGSASEAAAWVNYVFDTLNRTVEWWCVGNENYGPWEYDTNSSPNDAVTYAAQWIQFYDAMKAAEPSIKVGITGAYAEDDWTNSHPTVTNPVSARVYRGWNAVLLTHLAQSNRTPDFFELHYYGPRHDQAVPWIAPERANDFHLLQSAPYEKRRIEFVRTMLTDYLGNDGTNVEIHVTENNCDGYNPGKTTLSLVNALYAVEMFGQACLGGADALMWWDLHNNPDTNNNLSSTLYGWRDYADYGILATGNSTTYGDSINERYPAFYAHKMLTNFAAPGYRLVEVTNNYPDILHTYAALSADTNTLSVMAVNTSLESGLRPTLNLQGFTAASNATVHYYGKTQDSNRTDIVTETLSITPTNIQYTFRPYSVTVLKLKKE